MDGSELICSDHRPQPVANGAIENIRGKRRCRNRGGSVRTVIEDGMFWKFLIRSLLFFCFLFIFPGRSCISEPASSWTPLPAMRDPFSSSGLVK